MRQGAVWCKWSHEIHVLVLGQKSKEAEDIWMNDTLPDVCFIDDVVKALIRIIAAGEW